MRFFGNIPLFEMGIIYELKEKSYLYNQYLTVDRRQSVEFLQYLPIVRETIQILADDFDRAEASQHLNRKFVRVDVENVELLMIMRHD
jgi:hypothetical protein